MRSFFKLYSLVILVMIGCKTQTFKNNENQETSLNGQASLSGAYTSTTGVTVTISAGRATITQSNGSSLQGTLDRDGTMGGNYIIRFPEGYVCGTYNISLWVAEGQVGDGSTFKMTWKKPDGSVARQCSEMANAEGSYSRKAKPTFAGTYSDSKGNTVVIQDGKFIIARSSGEITEGSLDRDGTMGGNYIVRFPEGYVCGTYNISLWVAEGQVGDGSSFKMSWKKPEGSVVRQCADMMKAEGSYKKVSQFGGYYRNNKASNALVIGGRVKFKLPDGNRIEGLLERDGSMGGAYLVRMEEGFVCGKYRISLFVSEGVVGEGSTFQSTWIAPEGSVRQKCGYMTSGEGQYTK